LDNLQYLFAAYTAIWVALFVYVNWLHRRERGLWNEVEQLRAELTAAVETDEKKPQPGRAQT
jgi:CcmD family protein